MLEECLYSTREDACQAVARRIGDALAADLDDNGEAAIVVSGGSTPGPVFRQLAERKLPWERVTVTLSDERWVKADHADSNEKMLRATLLQKAAAAAHVMSLFQDGLTAAAASPDLARLFGELPLPFSSVMLGMGEDGHFASLFPDYAGLQAALDADGDDKFVAVQTAASPHPRISMTMSALLQSREIILLFFGDKKRKVYEQAKAGEGALPVAHLIAQSRVPVRLVWAP